MNNIISSLIALAAGSTLLVNGVLVHTDDITRDAKRVANQANLHQLATVLEIYYLDHNEYPQVKGGDKLVDTLYNEGYLRTKPLDSSVFDYEPKGNEDFFIRVRDGE